MQQKDISRPLIKLIKLRYSKSLRLSVSKSGEVKLTAPINIKTSEINKFLSIHNDWLNTVLENLPISQKLTLKTGEKINILDQAYTLELKVISGIKPRCYLDSEQKLIYIFTNSPELDTLRLIKTQLIKLARREISATLSEYAQKYQYQYNKVAIREQKSRWGSCSNKGNLNFNWKIILAPISVYYYVITHELAHLKQHNHSTDFWNLVEVMQPDYRNDRKWLKNNSHLLEII